MIATRKIIHCDCDSFYASVEIRDKPALRGLPVAVGGNADRRGVLTTCNYEARAFGVRSAMPTAQALRLCPELIVLPVAMDKYREASKGVRAVFDRYSDCIEPLSLDEAFLDVSDSEACQGSATLIAKEIKAAVKKEVGITISAGVAPNKFLAKIASDWQKPDGLTVIRPEQVAEFVQALPVKKIFGVGPVMAERLKAMGVETCADLQTVPLLTLIERFGTLGNRLHDLARGVDDRPVQPSRSRKSLSVEHTLNSDIETLPEAQAYLEKIQQELDKRLQRAGNPPFYKIFVKLKFSDFSQTTAEAIVDPQFPEQAQELLATAWQRSELGVRLIGLGVRFHNLDASQLDLFQSI
jgi:DNA polymerase-4